jgi:hypothetical protein
MDVREFPGDRVTPEHRGVKPLLFGLLAGEDVLHLAFDDLAKLGVIAETAEC